MAGLPDKDKSPAPSPRDVALEDAQRQAQSTKKPVIVSALTTETSLTTAQPDGRFTTDTALGPVRYRQDGKTGADETGKATWADLDLSLTGQDAQGRTTAESAGPWSARLSDTSGAAMVAVGPANQTITWSPSAAAAPIDKGGPTGALPAISAQAPAAGVTPAASGVELEVPKATNPDPRTGQGADAPAPVLLPEGSTPSSAISSSAGTTGAGGSVGNDAVFPDVLKGGRDYTVTVTPTGAEESVVLASRQEVTASGGPAAASVYRNTFTLPAGVTARQASGSTTAQATALGVEFVDATGTVIATFGGGKAFDSSGSASAAGAKNAGDPATAPVATRLLAATPGAGASTGSATVEVSVDPAWVADPARVFPLTIDPHIASGTGFSGSTGPNGSNNFDAYVDEAYPTTAEGVQDSGRLLAGYRPINGATKGSTTLVYFNLGDLIGSENTITSAQFSLWNNYSYSCTATGLWVDAATGPWNPATVTWNTRPGWANAGSKKTFAHGYSSSCAAAAEFYDVTPIVQKWSNSPNSYYGGLNNYGFIITADGTAASGYKRFNSAETGSGMPGLTVSWENCTNYPAGAGGSGTRKVCGSIRDDYAANGGPSGFGLPTTNDAATPNGKGFFNHFDKSGQGRSIYWSPASGAHTVVGAIRDKWAADGWETSLEGWPSSDDHATPSGEGVYNHFLNLSDNQTRSIYWTSQYSAHRVGGLIRDRWAALGWEATQGYPTSEEIDAPGGGGKVSYFAPTTNGRDGQAWGTSGIYWKTGASAAWSVHGRIYQTYKGLGETSSWLGYPISNEYTPSKTPAGAAAPSDAKQVDFENGSIYGDSATGYAAVAKAGTAGQRVDDSVKGTNTNQFQYTGTWEDCSGCGNGLAYQNGFQYAYDTGASASFRFTGKQVTLYGTKEPVSGIATVAIDGQVVGDLDLYSSTYDLGAIYTSPVLIAGAHTVTLTVSGRQNSASDGTTLAIDSAEYGFAERATTTLAVSNVDANWTPVDDATVSGSANFAYQGQWQDCGGCNADAYQGGFRYSFAPGAAFSFRFTGVQARFRGTLEPSSGIAVVNIDGQSAGEIDLYSPDYKFDSIYTTDLLTAGPHTVTFTLSDRRNADSDGSVMSIDRADFSQQGDPQVQDQGGVSAVDMDQAVADDASNPAYAYSQDDRRPQTLSSTSCGQVSDDSEYCWTPLAGADLQAADAELASQGSDVTLLSSSTGGANYCAKRRKSASTRRNICRIGTADVINTTKTSFGTFTGTTRMTYRAHAWLDGALKADQVLKMEVTFTVGDSEGVKPPSSDSFVKMSMGCFGKCAIKSNNASRVLQLKKGQSMTWSVTADPANLSTQSFGDAVLWYQPTTYILNSDNRVFTAVRTDLAMRCDSFGNFTGCVNASEPGEMQFSKTTMPAITSHIVSARRSGLPGLLTRDSAGADARRARVCGKSATYVYKGKSYWCDEYPFASTLQGGNPPTRIPPGCVLPQSGWSATNPDPFGSSKCLVPESEQRSQAGTITKWTNSERILDGDSYNVKVVS